ncbi:hypothetical protein NUU61_004578 [Penicillium alfredii]|uniref:Uncharacterized protein n=1 Tax=Penicillium alfredii TaxID=1506179 RepID=A0A9W9FLE0_9EURO|nr:uncharacterized protein NUU61_004578 [Penicillium alfredii]KAJ5102356.1 hypothetical protein NUU61_004578 [Penicillium alfredii]
MPSYYSIPWLPNRVSAGQLPGHDPCLSGARPPAGYSPGVLFPLVTPDLADSRSSSAPSSAHTQPAVPSPGSGASATRPSPRFGTRPSRGSTERSSSGRRDSQRAIPDLVEASLPAFLGRGDGREGGYLAGVPGRAWLRDEDPATGQTIL